MNLCRYLLEKGDASAPALLTANRSYTYADLAKAAASVAGYLTESGGRKGERVLLASEGGFFWVSVYLGVAQAGLVCVPLPSKIGPTELKAIVSSVEPRFAFLEQKLAPKLLSEMGSIKLIVDGGPSAPLAEATSFNDVESFCGHGAQFMELDPDDLAALMFTSGSTGLPRGTMVSVRNIIANTDSINEYLGIMAADRIMAILPFHYCFGASLLHTHLRAGGSVVVDSRFMYPDLVLERMVQTKCTGFAGVPSHYQILLRRSSLRRMSFPHLRYVQQAGGHLAPTFVNALREALPGKQIFIMYGQTEATARLAYLPPELLATKQGAIGRAIPGVTLEVLDDRGRPVLPGQIGEIVARGENVTLGYWRDENETAKCFRDDRLYTGDLATVDEEGLIYIVDRAKDFVKCGGQRVSCRMLEDVLLESDLLVEAAVVGFPDEVLGEAVRAFVVPCNRNTDSIRDKVIEHCRRRLPPQQVPKEVITRGSLPKNSSGKVLKQSLREHGMSVGRHA